MKQKKEFPYVSYHNELRSFPKSRSISLLNKKNFISSVSSNKQRPSLEQEYVSIHFSNGLLMGIVILILVIVYLLQQLYSISTKYSSTSIIQPSPTSMIHMVSSHSQLPSSISSPPCNAHIFTNPYIPPINTSNMIQRETIGQIWDDPMLPLYKSERTRSSFSTSSSFSQLGILTKSMEKTEHPLILPLMGRPIDHARGKYQYYTFSNTGMVNTKLQIRIHNKICTNEYGCDELYSGDTVYVQGYNELFSVIIYETYSYPYHANVL